MTDKEPAFARQLDEWERATATRYRTTEPIKRGTEEKGTQVGSRGTREAPAQHRARQQAFASLLKQHTDPEEKKIDRLEAALRRKEQEWAGSNAGATAGAVVNSHRANAKRAMDGDWKNGKWGVGYGSVWADRQAIEVAKKSLNLKNLPDKKDPKYQAFWNKYWDARAEIVKPLSDAQVEEMSCLTMMQKPLESYVKTRHLVSGDRDAEQRLKKLIAQAHDARPHPTEDQDARGTVVLEELRKQFGFETVHVDALKGDPKKYWNNQTVKNYSSDADARKHNRLPKDESHRTVDGEDSHKPVDVSVGIDHFVKLGGKKTSKETREWWKALKDTEFAVGVADQGFHTFAISRGEVYEVHWDRGPDDPKLTGKRTLEDFFRPDRENGFGWGSGIIAIPPEAFPQTPDKDR